MLRIAHGQEIVCRGRKDSFPRSLLSQTWGTEIDAGQFPGAADLGVSGLQRALKLILGENAGFRYQEISAALIFLDYLCIDRCFWLDLVRKSAELPELLICTALAAGSTKLQVDQTMAVGAALNLQVDLSVSFFEACTLFSQVDLWPDHHQLKRIHQPQWPSPGKHRLRDPQSIFQLSAEFPWFPDDFPWNFGPLGLTLYGGAAAHLLHGRGCSDLDFCLYEASDASGVSSRSELYSKAAEHLVMAIKALRDADGNSRILVTLDEGVTLKLMIDFGAEGDGIVSVQFLLTIFKSISELLMTCDIDATQVAYCGPNQLYFSPMAVEAYRRGCIRISRAPGTNTSKRLAKYACRGFGIEVEQSLIDIKKKFEQFKEMLATGGIELTGEDSLYFTKELLHQSELRISSIQFTPVSSWETSIYSMTNITALHVAWQEGRWYSDVGHNCPAEMLISSSNLAPLCQDGVVIEKIGKIFHVPCWSYQKWEQSITAGLLRSAWHPDGTACSIPLLSLDFDVSFQSGSASCKGLDQNATGSQTEQGSQCSNDSHMLFLNGVLTVQQAADSEAATLHASNQAAQETHHQEIRHAATVGHHDTLNVPAPNGDVTVFEASKDEQLMEAIIRSKLDLPKTGVPLSSDGVVVLRITRMARSPEVLAILQDSPLLAEARQTVQDAGCQIEPPWAMGAKILVPLTQGQLEEAGIELQHHHIVALVPQVEAIRSALKGIAWKKRPKLAATDPGSFMVSRHAPASCSACEPFGSCGTVASKEFHAEEGTDSDIDVIAEYTFTLCTDSSLGFPQSSYHD